MRKPFLVKKPDSKFSKPLTVNKQTGASTYLLSDGRHWNVVRFSRCAGNVKEDSFKDSLADPKTCPRSVRMKRSPIWMKDYVA